MMRHGGSKATVDLSVKKFAEIRKLPVVVVRVMGARETRVDPSIHRRPPMKLTALTLLAVLPTTVLAGPDRLSVLLGSNHINATEDFQEFNPGVFLTWERNLNYSIGAYYNSYERVSVLASIGYDYEIARDFDVGIFGALALYPGDGDRFRHSAGDVVPLVGLQARYKNVFVQFIPADGDSLDSLFTFGLTFELN
jgi:hypothetical protein